MCHDAALVSSQPRLNHSITSFFAWISSFFFHKLLGCQIICLFLQKTNHKHGEIEIATYRLFPVGHTAYVGPVSRRRRGSTTRTDGNEKGNPCRKPFCTLRLEVWYFPFRCRHGIKRGASGAARRQTCVRRLRPFARRAASTLRPPFVAFLAR